MLKDEILKDNPNIIDSFDPELKRSFDVLDNEVPTELKNADNVRLRHDAFRLSGDGVFYTIQGEGHTMGLPAIFVRLHVCNLACVWCDAFYTWNPKSPEFWTESYLMGVDELIETIVGKWQPEWRKPRVIFTGGEPLLQQGLIDELMRKRPNWKYEIETNGTIIPTQYILDNAQFNCSPKLRNSKNSDIARIRGNVLQVLKQYNTWFKFVVMDAKELEEIEHDFVNPFELPKDRIILMPQGVTEKEVNHNAMNIVDMAKKKGYRVLGRLQVSIWGAKRRV